VLVFNNINDTTLWVFRGKLVEVSGALFLWQAMMKI